MRGVLLFILLTIPALFGCVSTDMDVAESTKTGEITAIGRGLNYHLSVNGNSELSYWDIISELREFGEEVDVERGLTGLNENGISENTATFSAGPEVSIDAFSRALELIVESRIYKVNIQLSLSDDTTVPRYLELPKEESFSWIDRTDKIHIRIDADGNTIMFEAWVRPNDYLSVPEEEVVFPDDDPGIVWPELDPPPTDDFDEDPIANGDEKAKEPNKHCFIKIRKPYLNGTSAFDNLAKYKIIRAELTDSLRRIIVNSKKDITSCIVHFNASCDERWGAFFMAIDAGSELGLKHPVKFRWAKYEHGEE